MTAVEQAEPGKGHSIDARQRHGGKAVGQASTRASDRQLQVARATVAASRNGGDSEQGVASGQGRAVQLDLGGSISRNMS